jgi:uncharacterized protein (DUF2147 family)
MVISHLVVIALQGLTNTYAQATPSLGPWLLGTWVAHNRSGEISAHVRFRPCNDGSPCGTLVWIDPRHATETLDRRNPNQALRTRPLIGSIVISGLKRHKTGWRGGRLYNPEDGMSFSCALAPGASGQLVVTGCLGPLCQTKLWRRVSHD